MQIKKYIATTLKEAVAQMKKELGKDAIVLQSKTVPRNGIFDYSGSEQVEILAAVDHDKGQFTGKRSGASHSTERFRPENSRTVIPPVPPSPERQVDPRDVELLKSDIKEIRATIGKVADFLKYRNLPALPENLLLILKQMLDNEVEEKLAKQIIQEVHVSLKGEEYQDLRLIVNMVIDKVGGYIKVPSSSDHGKSKGALVTVLVGPTGVGKTTTLAKLASNAKLVDGQRVAIISSDTFRIGAIEQLRTFAGIADIPFQVVYTPDEMEQAVVRFKSMDRIFIDTTGRCQRDKHHLQEMAQMVSTAHADEVHLVISATTKFTDMKDVFDNFRGMGYNRLLFTKLDETTTLGALLNILQYEKKPVSYITMGQTVPDDIEPIRTNRLARLILRRKQS